MRRATGLIVLVVMSGAVARAQDPAQTPQPAATSEHEPLEEAFIQPGGTERPCHRQRGGAMNMSW
jgi:hypothetical protein